MSKELTSKEIAEKFGIDERVARRWCKTGKFPNAHKVQTPRGDYWSVPETDLYNFELPNRGRKRIENPSKSTLAKRRKREQDKLSGELKKSK